MGHVPRRQDGRGRHDGSRTPSRTPSCSRPATATRSWPAGCKAGHGTFDAESARHLMDRPVAMKSNLHSVLFETTTTRLWVANASKAGEPGRRLSPTTSSGSPSC